MQALALALAVRHLVLRALEGGRHKPELDGGRISTGQAGDETMGVGIPPRCVVVRMPRASVMGVNRLCIAAPAEDEQSQSR